MDDGRSRVTKCLIYANYLTKRERLKGCIRSPLQCLSLMLALPYELASDEEAFIDAAFLKTLLIKPSIRSLSHCISVAASVAWAYHTFNSIYIYTYIYIYSYSGSVAGSCWFPQMGITSYVIISDCSLVIYCIRNTKSPGNIIVSGKYKAVHVFCLRN